MKKIDIDKWERKSHYRWFSAFARPTLAMDIKLDVTHILKVAKEHHISTFAVIMYVFSEALNHNRAFRLREYHDNVVEIDHANVAYTIMVNEDTFVNCRARTNLGFKQYVEDFYNNKKKYENSNFVQEEYNDVEIIDDIYCSCTPWINFLSVEQPIPDNNKESRSIPRLAWGAYYVENDKTYITLNITANHALVDGLDFAKVVKEMEAMFLNPTFLEDVYR